MTQHLWWTTLVERLSPSLQPCPSQGQHLASLLFKELMATNLLPMPSSQREMATHGAPTCRPAAQKSSLKTCRAVDDSMGSARGGREPSSWCTDFTSEPNTHDLMTGKQMPRPEQGRETQRQELTRALGTTSCTSLRGEASFFTETALGYISVQAWFDKGGWGDDLSALNSVDQGGAENSEGGRMWKGSSCHYLSPGNSFS